MRNVIRRIPLDRLVAHPDNPNRMSRGSFEKLVRNIERSGRYEPLVVRPCPGRRGLFQIINGYHRCEALRRLGHPAAEAVVWNVNDEQTDVLIATLNRLGGRDTLDKKTALLRRLGRRIPIRKLARLLPQTLGQIERLTTDGPPRPTLRRQADQFAIPMVFFVDDRQQRGIEEAVAAALGESGPIDNDAPGARTRTARRAAALTRIAAGFLALARDGREPRER
jgi:hypothetical protein